MTSLSQMVVLMILSYFLDPGMSDSEGNQCGSAITYTLIHALSELFVDAPVLETVTANSVEWCGSRCNKNLNCTSLSFNVTTNDCMLYRYRYTGQSNTGDGYLTGQYFVLSEEACPSADGYVLNRQPPMCFKIHNVIHNREDAETVCQENSGHLIDIDTMDKYNAVNTYLHSLGSTGRYYVALNSFGTIGVWQWSDGTDNTLGPELGVWNSNEPDDNSDQRCVAFGYPSNNNGRNGFTDTECSDTIHFICMKTA